MQTAPTQSLRLRSTVEGTPREAVEPDAGALDSPAYLGRFRVRETLGAGGMGVIYAALDEQLGRLVALKVVRYPEGPRHEDEQRRLLREARALARLSHPNVIHIYEVGEVDGDIFLAMEYVRGTTLHGWLRDARRSLPEILAVFTDAGRGLAAAHAAGIVHRDFKPSNVLVGEDGRVRLIDFGLALGSRHADDTPVTSGTVADEVSGEGGATWETRAGAIAGTPAYMPPESMRREVDARGDQFSFCVALYEAVGSSLPYGPGGAGRRPDPELVRDSTELVARLRAPGWLRRLLARGLELDPERRHPSMDALLAAMTETPRRRRRAALAGSFAVAALGGLLGANALTPAQELCPLAGEALVGVWDAEQRAGVRAAIVGTDLPYAAAVWSEVSAGLDDYTRRWLVQRKAACEATWVRREQSEAGLDRSMRCLDESLGAARSLVALLRAGERTQVAGADRMLASLPDPARCRAAAVLDADEQAPATPREREIQADLQRATLLLHAKQWTLARSMSERALADSVALRHPGLEAEALLVVGSAAHMLRDSARAVEALHRAYARATASRRDALVWRIWNELARVHAIDLQKPDAARTALDHARGAFARLRVDDPLAEAALVETEAGILRLEGRYAEAEERRRDVVRLLGSSLPESHPDLLWARVRLAGAIADAERQTEALAMLRELAGDQARRRGADHPGTAYIEHEIGLVLFELGEHAEAEKVFTHARAVARTAHGEGSPWVASIDLKLAQIAALAGQIQRALGLASRALAVLTERFPPHYSERIEALALLAELYRVTIQRERALEVYRALLEIEDRNGIDLDAFSLLINIGDNLCLLGRCGEALPYYSRVLSALASEPEGPEVRRAYPLQGLGRVHLAGGSPAVALPFLEEAMALLGRWPESSPEVRLATADLLADALQALQTQPERVEALRGEAAQLRRALGEATP